MGVDGFRAASPGADTFRFTERAIGLRAVERNDKRHVFGFSGEVSRIVVAARSPGFEATWRTRFSLTLTGVAGPVLTVPGASFGPGAPTAPAKWVLVTPGPGQPALMVVPLGGPTSFIVDGRPGDWTLRTEPPAPGAFRFCLADGHRRIEGQTPASLGQLAARVAPTADFWASPTPVLKSARLEQTPDGLKAVWTFDRPGAVVPRPLLLAREGGYPVKVLTDVVQSAADLPEGPIAFCREARLGVLFPLDPVPPGRALFRGAVDWPEPPADGAPAATWASVVSLFANRPVEPISASLARLRILERAESLEAVPADQLAAYAVLDASSRREDPAAPRGAVWQALTARRDGWTWSFADQDARASARSIGFAAVAAPVAGSLEDRLDGCMAQAALAFQAAWPTYLRRRGWAVPAQARFEPHWALRRRAYGLTQAGTTEPWSDALYGPWRWSGPERAWATATDDGFRIAWRVGAGPGSWKLSAPTPIKPAASTGLLEFLALAEPQGLRFTGRAAGPSEASVGVVSTVPLPPWPLGRVVVP